MAAFLDNTNDIILDAVLTDYGRQQLAKGDGSFNIVKFAFGDDEIDYSLWNAEAESPNEDTEIMSTPILEAFTNNAASMKSKLLTINIDNLLYLPIMSLNTTIFAQGSFNGKFTGYAVPVNETVGSGATNTSFALANQAGVVKAPPDTTTNIVVDQGFNSSNTDPKKSLSETNPDLNELEYNIMLDYRLGRIQNLEPVSIDDDMMATYRVRLDGTGFVEQIDAATDSSTVLAGNQGTRVEFRVIPQQVLETTETYFNKLGNTGVELVGDGGSTFSTIRSYVKVVGVTTGYSVDIPILYAKLEN